MASNKIDEFLPLAINSILEQTYQNIEVIFVANGDKAHCISLYIKNFFKDERIKYFKNAFNSGAAISRNRALREAKGRWIAFLDSDDIWKPTKLEKQLEFMQCNNYFFSYTNYEELDESGKHTGIKVTGPKKITKAGMYNYCWPGCLTVMYDAKYIGLIQIANIMKNNDYAVWLKVCKKADCYLLEECLAEYRRGRKGSISTNSIKTMIGWHYKLYREAEDYDIIRSVLGTLRNVVFGIYKKMRYVVKDDSK